MRLPVIAMMWAVAGAAAPGSKLFESEVVIQGTVIDEVTQRPLARARVRIASLNRTAFTDSLGRYRLDNLRGRAFSVRADAIGYISEVREVEAAYPPHVVCGGRCPPWRAVEVLNFYMRRRPYPEM